MEAPRHTTQQIADDVATGMDPNAECVASMYYDAVVAERDEWKRRCERRDDIVSRERAEAEIALRDLHNELARVKAESLRVVVVGEECALVDLELSECHLFRHVTGGPAYIMDTAIKGRSYTDSGRAHWCARVEGTVKEWSQYDDFAPVQPVRLERWEDADVLGE